MVPPGPPGAGLHGGPGRGEREDHGQVPGRQGVGGHGHGPAVEVRPPLEKLVVQLEGRGTQSLAVDAEALQVRGADLPRPARRPAVEDEAGGAGRVHGPHGGVRGGPLRDEPAGEAEGLGHGVHGSPRVGVLPLEHAGEEAVLPRAGTLAVGEEDDGQLEEPGPGHAPGAVPLEAAEEGPEQGAAEEGLLGTGRVVHAHRGEGGPRGRVVEGAGGREGQREGLPEARGGEGPPGRRRRPPLAPGGHGAHGDGQGGGDAAVPHDPGHLLHEVLLDGEVPPPGGRRGREAGGVPGLDDDGQRLEDVRDHARIDPHPEDPIEAREPECHGPERRRLPSRARPDDPRRAAARRLREEGRGPEGGLPHLRGIHAPREPGARLRGEPQRRGGGADRRGREPGGLQDHLRRRRSHLGVAASHEARHGDGALGVGDDEEARRQRPLPAVDGLHRLARAGAADDDAAPPKARPVEGMEGLPPVEHHVVGDVDDGVDEALAEGGEPAGDEGRRRPPVGDAEDHPRLVGGAEVPRLDGHGDGAGLPCAGEGGSRPRAEGLPRGGGDLPGDAEMGHGVPPVARDLHLEDGVRGGAVPGGDLLHGGNGEARLRQHRGEIAPAPRPLDVVPEPGEQDPHENCPRNRTSFSTRARMSSMRHRRMAARSMPMPKANPVQRSGSCPARRRTSGWTMPQPRSSIQPSPPQVGQRADRSSPPQAGQETSISAPGSVKGK